MSSPRRFVHPRWGLAFHWWSVDQSGAVALVYSAFGQVPWAANDQVQPMDRATKAAKACHPDWFAEMRPSGPAPHRFEWDEEHDDSYTRVDTPVRPVLVSELPDETAQVTLLIEVNFSLAEATRIDL